MEKTVGEKRVRTDFNVSGFDTVNDIKTKSAELINICEGFKPQDGAMMSGEQARLIALAQTSFEEGAMWAVKVATFQ